MKREKDVRPWITYLVGGIINSLMVLLLHPTQGSIMWHREALRLPLVFGIIIVFGGLAFISWKRTRIKDIL